MYINIMYVTVINDSEFEKWRTLRETKSFIDEVLKRIWENSNFELKAYTLCQGNYKNFKEEYIPMYNYLENKYGLDNGILFRHVGVGNQPYDGEAKVINNTQKIEIKYITMGREEKYFHKEWLGGEGAFRCGDIEGLLLSIKELITQIALKKAEIVYGDTLLLLYFASCDYVCPSSVGFSVEDFDIIANDLKKISYKAQRVDFFIPAEKYQNCFWEKNDPAMVYRIK